MNDVFFMIAKPGWALISPANLFALLPVLTSRLFQQAGLNPERLILETGSRNPAENFRQLQSLLPDADGRYLLVISAFYIAQSGGGGRKTGDWFGLRGYFVTHHSSVSGCGTCRHRR